ncbi:MAG: NAD(P)-dependent oxidoreductase [Eubacterium sp.]|nr:NAD(P)-dependent oxidoreductase [Eubacterium sp.]
MTNKDWTGNTHSTFVTLGASNHVDHERQQHDYYATDPRAMELLLEVERFNPLIWEPACGGGHLSEVLRKHKYSVISTDLYPQGYGSNKPFDFLSDKVTYFSGDIITNPPYKYAIEFVQKALDIVRPSGKVAMFLKLLFLETNKRRKLFEEQPFKTLYVSSGRIRCAMNGDFEQYKDAGGGATAYGWFVWEKGFHGDPVIKWIN